MYKVQYINDPVIYQLSEKMQSSDLFKTLIETGETVFTLNLFKELFIELNTTGLKLNDDMSTNDMSTNDMSTNDMSTSDINTLYEGLYYFGYNEGIYRLDKYVYSLELKNTQKQIEEFILKYPGIVPDNCIFKLNLTEEFFQSYYFDKNHLGSEIYDNKFLPNSFFKKNFSKCDKIQLKNRLYLTEDFVEEFNLFGGVYITDCKDLSEEFLERNIDKIDIIDNISEEFSRRHIEKLNWHRCVFNKKLSEAFFTDYYSEFKRRNLIDALCMSRTLSESFFERHKADITSHMSKVYLSINSNISEKFFRRNPELIEWNSIWINKNISEKFARDNIHKVNWKAISNSNMSLEFFEKHLYKLYLPDLCYNKYIPESFFEKHIDTLNWESLFANPSISEEFLERNIKHITGFYFKKLITYDKVSEEFVNRNKHLMTHFYGEKFHWYNSNLSLGFYERHIHLVKMIDNISIYKIIDKCKKYKYNSWKKLNKDETSLN
jgi:hypothetical protein